MRLRESDSLVGRRVESCDSTRRGKQMRLATRKWLQIFSIIAMVTVILIGLPQTSNANRRESLESINGPYELPTNGCRVGELKTFQGVCKSLSQVLQENTETSMRIVKVAKLIPNCQEDEDYATVNYQDPQGIEDVHGITRKCVSRDTLIIDGINRLILDGTLIWEWDL